MKNLLLIPVLVMALASVKASDLPTLSIAKDKSFVLNANDWKMDELTVSFLSSDGEEIYSEIFQPSDKKIRKYNLRELPAGTYTVVVANYSKSISYDLVYAGDLVTEVSEGEIYYTPQVFSDDQKIDINLLSLNKKVKIYLSDASGHGLHSEVIKHAPVVTRRINISRLNKGMYNLSINVDDKWYNHTIIK